MARVRRTKKEIINAKIEAVEAKMIETQKKIDDLIAQKKQLEEQLKVIDDAEAEVRKAKEMKKLLSLMDKKNLSVDDIKNMLDKGEE